MFKKLFGTDGIRGIWKDQISPELAFDIGKAVAIIFERENEINTIVVGKDTRLSCDTLETALISGIMSMGTNVVLLGVVPTAVIPFSIGYHKANAGIMVTASHNSAEYNGFKFFNGNGFKISEEQENHIEHIIANLCDYVTKKYDKLGKITRSRASVRRYVEVVRKELKVCKKTKICFDCANGCATEIVKEIFKGYDYTLFNYYPNGINTNLKCGASNIEEMQKIMEVGDFDIGLSFDGDADKVRVVTKGGGIISGEEIAYLLIKYNDFNYLVTTKMSNTALINLLEKEDIPCTVVEVGEKAVVEGLLETNAMLGAENNGHYVLMNKTTSSDGILVATQVVSIYETNNKLETPYIPYFQGENSVSVKNKIEIMKNPSLLKTIELCESLLGEKGRILVRPSGTENLVRILVEGEDPSPVGEIIQTLTSTIEVLNKEPKVRTN